MNSSIDLVQLQHTVSQYVEQYQLVSAAGPIGAALLGRLVFGKNKLAVAAVRISGMWFAVKEISGPLNYQLTHQFGYLQNLLQNFRG